MPLLTLQIVGAYETVQGMSDCLSSRRRTKECRVFLVVAKGEGGSADEAYDVAALARKRVQEIIFVNI